MWKQNNATTETTKKSLQVFFLNFQYIFNPVLFLSVRNSSKKISHKIIMVFFAAQKKS